MATSFSSASNHSLWVLQLASFALQLFWWCFFALHLIPGDTSTDLHRYRKQSLDCNSCAPFFRKHVFGAEAAEYNRKLCKEKDVDFHDNVFMPQLLKFEAGFFLPSLRHCNLVSTIDFLDINLPMCCVSALNLITPSCNGRVQWNRLYNINYIIYIRHCSSWRRWAYVLHFNVRESVQHVTCCMSQHVASLVACLKCSQFSEVLAKKQLARFTVYGPPTLLHTTHDSNECALR